MTSGLTCGFRIAVLVGICIIKLEPKAVMKCSLEVLITEVSQLLLFSTKLFKIKQDTL